MKAIILCVFVGLAVAQFPLRWGDNVHGYHFEYHSRHHLLLVRTSSDCFAIKVDAQTGTALSHHDTRVTVEDAIYNLIKGGSTGTSMTLHELETAYHDRFADFECRHHHIHTLTYSATSTGSGN